MAADPLAAHGEMMPAVLCSLPFEVAALRGRGEVIGGVALFRRPGAVIAVSGMGRRRAEAAVSLLASEFALSSLTVVGFAAGLEAARPGHLVLCRQVYEGVEGPSVASSVSLLEKAAAAARRAGLQFSVGRGLAVPGVLDRRAKRELSGSGFAVADMESYWALREAASRGIPGLVVRAVSDGPGQEVPPPEALLDEAGGWRKSAPLYLLRRPGAAWKLLRLAPGALRARRALTLFLDTFLEALA